MKNSTSFYTLLFLLIGHLAISQENSPYFTTRNKLEIGKTYEVFGNNIKLREAPNAEGEVLELLPLNSQVKIIAKTDKTLPWNGGESAWYQVDYNGMQGFIIGGLLADAKIKATAQSEVTFLFKIGEEDNQMTIKAYQNQELLSSISFYTIGYQYQLKSEATGFANIKEIIKVDYMADACGEQGGASYVFWDGTKLYHVADLRSMGDGGMAHESEEIIFPSDERNYHDDNYTVIFNSESGEMIDEEAEHYRTVSDSRKLVWKGDRFYPDIMKFRDNQ